MKYIDPELLKTKLDLPAETEKIFKQWIDLCPTVDVAPVIHSKWIVGRYCANCEYDNYNIACMETKYCPNCGAIMEKKK